MKKGNNKKNTTKSNAKTSSPLVIILMGLPGSGKSTISSELVKSAKKHGMDVAIACQDELGSADMCKKVIEKALKHGNHVIVDRVNLHPKDRKMWMTYGRSVNPNCRILLLWIDTPADVCIERIKTRKNHPTLGPEKAVDVVNSFQNGFKPPESWELGGGMKYELMLQTSKDEDHKDKIIEVLKK